LDVAGKTGTSTNASGLRAALFAGFAPNSSPQWIVAVALQGRSGGSDAAPVAADILREHSGPSYRVRVNNQILQVPVEQYVAAVLAGESSVFKHAEALKAMAVAARTYAAQQKGRHASEGFDFCNTTHCQRAEPDHIQPPLANAAHVTAGEILSWHHQTAFTPYTMSCGGCAEDVKTAWADVSAPYLRIHPDPYCGDTSWSCRIGFADIERALHQAGINCPAGLHRVTVRDRTPSGRARTLNLEGQGRGVVSAGAFRFAIGRTLGWNLVRSDWFDMNVTGSQLGLHGRGEGHGVGLCQRGAENMAAQGHTYREILGFYYPGTSSINWTRLGGQGVTVYATDSVQGRLVLTEAERILPGLRLSLARPIDIYVYPTLDAFRNHTAEPGWVAAHTQGGRIDLQPVQILQERGALHGTLLHEFLHVAVEIRAHPDLPVWFREGIVDWLAGHRANANAVRPPADSDLRQRNDRAQAEQAYRQAQSRVAALISRYGETTVVDWVSRGLPEEVKNSSANSDITNKR
jgi:stage II sporulation protein D